MRKSIVIFIALNVFVTVSSIRSVSTHMGLAARGGTAVTQARFDLMMNNFYEITSESSRKILLIGSSAWQYFLNPMSLDRAMAAHGVSSASYNLAFAGLFGPSTLVFTSRLDEEFAARGEKVGASILELSPLILGKEYYRRRQIELDVWAPAIFYSPRTWLRLFLSDPPNAAFLFFNNLVQPFDWKYLKPFTRLIGDPDRSWKPVDVGVTRMWTRPEYQEGPPWNAQFRGLSNWGLPKTQALFDKDLADLHEEKAWAATVAQLALVHGVNGTFAFDSRLVDIFLDSIRMTKRYSTRTYVVIFSYAPSLQNQVNEFVDYDYLKRKIYDETGVQVIDLRSDLSLKDDDFADGLHPKADTMDRFLKLLADRAAADFKNSAANN